MEKRERREKRDGVVGGGRDKRVCMYGIVGYMAGKSFVLFVCLVLLFANFTTFMAIRTCFFFSSHLSSYLYSLCTSTPNTKRTHTHSHEPSTRTLQNKVFFLWENTYTLISFSFFFFFLIIFHFSGWMLVTGL